MALLDFDPQRSYNSYHNRTVILTLLCLSVCLYIISFLRACTGWPNKNRTFLRYHIFAATTDIIMWFLLKCSEMTAENNKQQFLKRVLNILCKMTRNGLRHS